MSYAIHEEMCALCRVPCAVEMLEHVEIFPMGLACPPCAAELRADEEDPHGGESECEPECVCRAFCAECLGGEGGVL